MTFCSCAALNLFSCLIVASRLLPPDGDGESKWPLLMAHGMSFDFDVLFRTPKNYAAQSARGRAEP